MTDILLFSSYWLFSTLDKCCAQHFLWNYEYCIGFFNHGQCVAKLWYPDWEGENNACLNDGNEPFYMLHNPSNFMYSTKEACCTQHYDWNIAEYNSGSVTGNSNGQWYPDWETGDCKNDGEVPKYMTRNKYFWLHDGQEGCCKTYFNYKLDDCTGTSASAGGNGKYYPDWDRNNNGCLIDDTSNPAPEYMSSSGNWFFDTLRECCESHFGWMESECRDTSG
jgi:hypothetical protein